jgi:hypothetical protein
MSIVTDDRSALPAEQLRTRLNDRNAPTLAAAVSRSIAFPTISQADGIVRYPIAVTRD